jgi:hypothetical protein
MVALICISGEAKIRRSKRQCNFSPFIFCFIRELNPHPPLSSLSPTRANSNPILPPVQYQALCCSCAQTLRIDVHCFLIFPNNHALTKNKRLSNYSRFRQNSLTLMSPLTQEAASQETSNYPLDCAQIIAVHSCCPADSLASSHSGYRQSYITPKITAFTAPCTATYRCSSANGNSKRLNTRTATLQCVVMTRRRARAACRANRPGVSRSSVM